MEASRNPTRRAAARPAAVAGLFYPLDATALEAEVRNAVERGAPTDLAPEALVLPHAGYVYSGAVKGSGYRSLRNLERAVGTVFVLGPAHRVYTRGVAAPGHERFETPLGEVPVARAALDELRARFDYVRVSAAAHAEEHCIEVHLPFLQVLLGDFELAPLVVGDLAPAALAGLMEHLMDVEDGLVIVSSDLSHYHDYDEARRIDSDTIRRVEALDWRSLDGRRACGFVPLGALLIEAARRGLRVKSIDARNSGDTAGPRERVVGYGSFVVYDDAGIPAPADKARLLRLAREAILKRLEGGAAPDVDPAAWPRAMRGPAATFVTLRKRGVLRGCIGNHVAERPLPASVAENACRAAFEDPRFPPLRLDELEQLRVSISILSEPEPLPLKSERDLLERLRPGVDGLVLSHGTRRATFLPSVWESLPTPRAFVRALKRKAGLDADFWSPDLAVERYTALSFGEAREERAA